MELLKLNCRRSKIQIDETLISSSGTLSAYWEFVNKIKCQKLNKMNIMLIVRLKQCIHFLI